MSTDRDVQRRKADVIVVGAGPAGSTTAAHLARSGVATLLIDKSGFPRDKVCGDGLSPRAQHFLARLGVLERVEAEARSADHILFRSPSGFAASTAVTGAPGMPDRTLVMPRRRLDHMLQQQAIADGAVFQVAHVRQLLRRGGRVVGVELAHQPIEARLVVIATGASIGLLKEAGLAPRRRVHTVAARGYFQGLPDLGTGLRVFFDGLPLPGYAWLFPVGPHTANLGYWYSGRRPLSVPSELARLLDGHAALSQDLAGATLQGAIAGSPIRTDFLRAPVLADGLLCVGEAAGLVNPFTGEGIDYAIESGELAARAITAALANGKGPVAASALAHYRRDLDRHFRSLFLLIEAVQR
jgi:menaquinone-9 beta-reductase